MVINRSHALALLQGWGSRFVDPRDQVRPILLEGVDLLGNWWGFVFPCDPILEFLGVYPAALDDV